MMPIALGAIAFAAIIARLWLQREALASSDWLFGENAWLLLAADEVRHGHQLFADIQWNYGALPIWYYVFAEAVFGRSVWAFYAGNALLFAVGFGLVGVAFQQQTGRRGLLGLVALLFVLLEAGAKGLNTGLFEFVVIAVAVVTLGARFRHESTRGILLGCLVGLLQWVKFGSGVVLFGSLVILCLPALLGRNRRHEVRLLLPCALTAAACELIRWIYYYCSLPPGYAWDVIFPVYHLQWYNSYITSQIRYPRWSNMNLFAVTQLPMIAGLLLPALMVWRAWRASADKAAVSIPPLFLPVAFYLIGCAGYFRHVYHFHEYLPVLAISLAFVVVAQARWVSGLALLALTPMALHVPFAVGRHLFRPTEAVTRVDTLHGPLWLSPADAVAVTRLRQALADHHLTQSPLLVLPQGIGAYYFLNLRHVGRQVWLLGPLLRPYEYDGFRDSLLQSKGALILFRDQIPASIRSDPRAYLLQALAALPPASVRSIQSSLGDPVELTPTVVWIPIRSDVSKSRREQRRRPRQRTRARMKPS